MTINKPSRLSREKLLAHLTGTYKIAPGSVSFEAYGKKVCAYVFAGTPQDRAKMEKELPNAGFRVNPDYSPGSSTVEVTNISYFKATNWNE